VLFALQEAARVSKTPQSVNEVLLTELDTEDIDVHVMKEAETGYNMMMNR